MNSFSHILINQDLAQAENRVVAYVFGEEKMVAAFEQGVDIHRQTAALIAEIPVEQVTQQQRDELGKRANHGLNYDLGFKTFALFYQISEAQAKFIVERYHKAYPGVREGHAIIRETLSRENRTLTNCQGRKRTFLGRWGHDLFKVAYSYIPQSTIGEKLNQDGVVFVYTRQDLFPDVGLLNAVHDNVLYQVSLASGPARIVNVAKRIQESLESPLTWNGRSFSIPADTELGFFWDKRENSPTKMLKWRSRYLRETPVDLLAGELNEYVEETLRLVG